MKTKPGLLMKNYSRRFALIAVCLIAALAVSACDSITDINENPNASSEEQVPFLLTNAQTETGGIYWDDFALGRFAAFYAQYFSATTYDSEPRFGFPTQRATSNSAIWNTYYGALNDLQEIQRLMRTEPQRAADGGYGDPQDVAAIAGIQQAWIWQVLTDTYGPIPLDSALAGRGALRPGYASQETVYNAIIDSLTAASQALSGGQALSSADLVFDGDTQLWQAFANGLKMRYALRMSCAGDDCTSGGPGQDAFVEAFNATTFTDIEGFQRALIPFSQSSPYQNPLYVNAVVQGRPDWSVSKTILDQMNPVNDPRIPAYAAPSTGGDGDFNGIPYGLLSGDLSEFVVDYSPPSERVQGTADSPSILYTEAEELFMLAEAAERGWISGDAAGYYEDAIRASVDYWGGSADEAEALIGQVPYDNSNGWAPPTDENPTWVQTLGTQKWIALYLQGIQGWSEFRRLDFDNVFVMPPGNPGQAVFGKAIPLRLPYPDEEAALNGDSRQNAVMSFLNGNDTQGEPLWWDDGEVAELKESVVSSN